MKTLIVLFTLAVFVTATPAVFPKDVETFKQSNKWDIENSQFYRQKKSPSLPIEETSPLKGQNIEDRSVNLAEERHLGLKKPIVIKKKYVYHRQLDSGEDREFKNNCESPVQVKVCNEETETLSNKMNPTSAARSDMAMTEHEMENSIQIAKNAIENLQRDFLNIERKSQSLGARSDTELDSELHSNIDIARKALENIHQSFGDVEAMNLKDAKNEDNLKVKLSDVERLAQWKEAMENIQRNIEKARNIEDGFKSDDSTKDTFEREDTTNNLQGRSDIDTSDTKDFVKELKPENNISEKKLEELSDPSNLSDKKRSDVENIDMTQMQSNTDTLKQPEQLGTETNLKMTTDTEIKTPVSHSQTSNDNISSEINRSETENNGLLKQFDNMANSRSDNLMTTQDFKSGKEENNGRLTMKSYEPMELQFTSQMRDQNEPLVSMWAQEKSSDDGKQKLFDTLSMRLSENDSNKPELSKLTDTLNSKNNLLENNVMRLTPENNLNNQEHTTFKMSPTNMIQQQNLNTHHSSHMPMPIRGHHTPTQFDTTDVNFDQNNVNVFQNQDNSMIDINQQQTAEDPFFMRWAAEQQRNNMGAHNSGMNLRTDLRTANMNDLHNVEGMNQFEMTGNDELSALGTNMHDHDHMHVIHHENMDNSMQPSMRTNMMTNLDKPAFDYKAMQWANQGLARSSYASGDAYSAGAYSGYSGPGAVGVFPNAKVGGCAIPLLVSCSPSLATGSLAKPHAQSSYPTPSYRSGDNMVYYMKRDTKEDDNLYKSPSTANTFQP